MREEFLVILIAIALGIIDYFLGGAISLFLIFGIMTYFIYKNSDPADRKFIAMVFIAGFILRVSLAVLFHAVTYVKGCHGISGDDLLYTIKSWALVYRWEGKPYSWVYELSSSSPTYGLNPFTYVLALYYKCFGFHPVTAKFINCMIGSLMGYFSYLIAKEMFDLKTARISMLVVTFYPSMIRWSIANLKDPMIMLLFTICLYTLISALGRKIKIWKLLSLLISAVALYQFTPRLYFVLIVGGICLAVFLRLFGEVRRRVRKILLAGLAVLVLFASVFYFTYVRPGILIELIYECEQKQAIMAKSDFAGYYFYPGKFMDNLSNGIILLPTFLNIIFKNVVYFMLAPFLWQITSPERLLAFPQMILWYWILALSIFGFAKLFVQKPVTGFLVCILLFVGITASALAEGNVGSAFRHRDIFTPVFIIFAASVISDFMRSKNRVKGCDR